MRRINAVVMMKIARRIAASVLTPHFLQEIRSKRNRRQGAREQEVRR
jgi:hypothetical protein